MRRRTRRAPRFPFTGVHRRTGTDICRSCRTGSILRFMTGIWSGEAAPDHRPEETVVDRLAQRAQQVRSAEDLAELLRALRRRHARLQQDSELTYREMAARTGWSHTAISEYL